MKISFYDTGSLEALAQRVPKSVLGLDPTADVLVCESSLQDFESFRGLVINASIGARGWTLMPEIADKLAQEYFDISKSPAVSSLYALYNGKVFSDWIEVVYSTRVLTGDVGPQLPYVTGTALPVYDDITLAVAGISKLSEFLQKLNYRGEVYVGISDDFKICKVALGHFYGHFALFAEGCADTVQQIIEFMAGIRDSCTVQDSLVISNLVTPPGFPNNSAYIPAPKNAEKHLWRISLGRSPCIIVTVYGKYLKEARRRFFRTMMNLRALEDAIQYRTDCGIHCKFLLCGDKYAELSRREAGPIQERDNKAFDSTVETVQASVVAN